MDSPSVLEFLVQLTAAIGAGIAPGRDMLCACRLTPLKKKDGGLRAIAVGELIYRLATKTLIAVRMSSHPLLPYQLGVRMKGGVESIVRAAERALDVKLDQTYTHLASLDASNAFNAMCRTVISGSTPVSTCRGSSIRPSGRTRAARTLCVAIG